MHIVIDPDWRSAFIRTAHTVTGSERNALARLARSGGLQRIAPGIYREPRSQRPTAEETARDLVYAHELRTGGRRTFVDESAAALWRLPIVGDSLPLVHVADARGGGHSSASIRRHATGLPDSVVFIDGIRVSGLAETVVSLMRTRPLAGGLAAADAALVREPRMRDARVTRDHLADVMRGLQGRGMAGCRQVFALADGAAESPGESVSRATMFRLGLVEPLLQFRLEDRHGEMFGDFCWPQHGLIGEFDGVGKYVRDEWMGGRDAAQVVIDEKRREDRIRALGWRVVRWGWAEARSPALLSALLVGAGLPRPSADVRTTWARAHVLG